jgi:uncharacterized protein YfaS (alpha-2-macroglobulin family)
VLSDKPPIDIRGAVQDLLTYPYGCGEQLNEHILSARLHR